MEKRGRGTKKEKGPEGKCEVLGGKVKSPPTSNKGGKNLGQVKRGVHDFLEKNKREEGQLVNGGGNRKKNETNAQPCLQGKEWKAITRNPQAKKTSKGLRGGKRKEGSRREEAKHGEGKKGKKRKPFAPLEQGKGGKVDDVCPLARRVNQIRAATADEGLGTELDESTKHESWGGRNCPEPKNSGTRVNPHA